MAITGLRPYLTGIALVIFFSFLILGFTFNMIIAKNPSSDVLSTYNLNNTYQDVQKPFSTLNSLSQYVTTTMEKENPSALDYIFLIFKGAFFIPQAMLQFCILGIGLISTTMTLFFGNATIGLIVTIGIGLMVSIMAITVVLLIIKAIRLGESER